jgi:myo-inositol 2-dehydrogenase / D-chiro-inositol 1-dehydrogenase
MPTRPSPAGPVYRGAIIGSGGIARGAHIPALCAGEGVRDRVELVALVDPAADLSPVAGLTVPLLRDREALERIGPLDFIDICTPTASHVELVLWGLERGYHVVCEKPVAVTRAEARRIAAAARAAHRIVMPCHQYRYNPAWLRVRDWLRDGAIGHWHLAEFAVYRQGADSGARPAAQPWRGLSDASRGGVLLDHGTHLIYQLLDVGGMPAAVRAWTGRLLHRRYDVEDTAGLLLEYADRVAVMWLTWAARQRETRMRFMGDSGSIEWAGGELRLERDGRVERHDFARELDKASYWRWFAALFRDFVAALDAGEADPFLEDITRVAAVLELAYAASRPAAIEVPLPAPA